MTATLFHRILTAAAGDSFALIRRGGSPFVEVIVGESIDVENLADIPLTHPGGSPADVLALVPFRQIRERGFDATDDATPLRCLVVSARERVDAGRMLAELQEHAASRPAPSLVGGGFEQSDESYAEVVSTIIDDEIGRGEGANFVIRRDFVAQTSAVPRDAVLAWFAALLEAESGAYWTFAVHTPGTALAGASPERHLSVSARGAASGTAASASAASGARAVMMNPISGTYRHPADGPTAEGLHAFLRDSKETEELFMVVDEELKMMSQICSEGGRIVGPQLTQMRNLTHTEYTLEGNTALGPVDALRMSMFAPTVTGSPMQNACAVIAEHETTGRGYYAGVLALFEADENGSHSLDAPILIRTAYLDGGGTVTVPVGATLVRNSDPASEVAETWSKASGILTAIGAIPGRPRRSEADLVLSALPGVPEALAARNSRLADFWLARQSPAAARGEKDARRVTIVDAEDDFSAMLAHQLRSLGLSVRVVPWSADGVADDCDLLVAGPGPGDPTDLGIPRIARMHEIVRDRLASGRPLLAVCLSHQVLAVQLGLSIVRLEAPHQGVALSVPQFGESVVVGFYNTFSAVLPPDAVLPDAVEASSDAATGRVYSLRGPGFASVQGHLESVLSLDGLAVLGAVVDGILAPVPA